MRTDRLCFGTDYPYDMHTARDIATFVDNIKQLDIPDTDKKAMLGENIKNFFRI